MLGILREIVAHRLNVIVSGATGSGKTTLSKAMIAEIPLDERLIAIEDAKELQFPHANTVRLFFSRDGAGVSPVTVKDLLVSCLRMKPDRIMLAELRDDETYFYLRNVGSGHPGSITTIHANSAAAAVEQLMLMVRQSSAGAGLTREDIRGLVFNLVDVIIQMERKRVTEIRFLPEISLRAQCQCCIRSGAASVLKRPTTAIKWVIALSIPLGLASFLPAASWVYAELCDYKFMVLVWLSGLQHGLQPDNLLLAGLAGGASAIGIPAFVAFALLPPKPLHGSARLARPGEIAKAKLYKAGPIRSCWAGIAASCWPSTATCIPSSPRRPVPARVSASWCRTCCTGRARPSCWTSRGRTTA